MCYVLRCVEWRQYRKQAWNRSYVFSTRSGYTDAAGLEGLNTVNTSTTHDAIFYFTAESLIPPKIYGYKQ